MRKTINSVFRIRTSINNDNIKKYVNTYLTDISYSIRNPPNLQPSKALLYHLILHTEDHVFKIGPFSASTNCVTTKSTVTFRRC